MSAGQDNSVLLTGGLGYIGSHTCIELLSSGYEVVLLDNLVNSDLSVLKKISSLANKEPQFIYGDVRDSQLVAKIIEKNAINSVIHFAGLKSVSDSIHNPLDYYDVNFGGTRSLLSAMKHFRSCRQLIFSSSATVYGYPNDLPVTEEHRIDPLTPYGFSKSFCEQLLQDISISEEDWNITILRYFNPIGAHPSGEIGEFHKDTPNNIMPNITRTAAGLQKEILIFGSDYETPDGTGSRDFVHVCDVAQAHLQSMEVSKTWEPHCSIFNIGTGEHTTVLEMINKFEEISGVRLQTKILSRRDGDVAICYASAQKANNILNWKAKYSLEDMCRDAWNFQLQS